MKRGPGNIFGWLMLAFALLVLNGCGPCPVEDRSSSPPVPTPETEAPAPAIRLQAASGSGVLILEEESDASRQREAADTGGLSGKPAPPLPPGHQGFRDHHVILYVVDGATGLQSSMQAAAATGGQLITYPISGFEDLGADERILVFDSRTYPSFLRRIDKLGETEYSEIGPSDFVTVRLTVKEKELK